MHTLEALVVLPLLAAVLAFALPGERLRPWLLPLTAAVHLVLSWQVSQAGRVIRADHGWLVLDPLGKVVLLCVSVMFLACALYAPGYLNTRPERRNRVLVACMLLSLGMMSLVALSHHLGLMWVAMEATTLVSAPGIYFNHNSRSLEATWKYLLVGSVGIALALLGSFFLAYSCVHAGLRSSLLFEDLMADAPQLSLPWLHAAFVFLFVGYGTKMGLAPMHTWKPDAYGEAPGMIGALLATGLSNCSFLAVLRIYEVVEATSEFGHAARLLVFMGLLSVATAAAFLVWQEDFKRMLAYSSVEHMGLLILGIGLGGQAVYASLFHLWNSSLGKGAMFLSAGNIHRVFGSKRVEDTGGGLRVLPWSGWLFLLGFLATTGTPPFGAFASEWLILTQAIANRGWDLLVAGLLVLLLWIIFMGLGGTVLAVLLGDPPPPERRTQFRESSGTVLPPFLLLAGALTLGIYLPAPLQQLLQDGAEFLSTPRQATILPSDATAAAALTLPSLPADAATLVSTVGPPLPNRLAAGIHP